MATTEERLTLLEDVYRNLPRQSDLNGVKVDVANLETRLTGKIGDLEVRLTRDASNQLRWVIVKSVLAVGATAAIASAIATLL